MCSGTSCCCIFFPYWKSCSSIQSGSLKSLASLCWELSPKVRMGKRCAHEMWSFLRDCNQKKWNCSYPCTQAACRAWSHTCPSSFRTSSSVCLIRRPWCALLPAGHWAATLTGSSASPRIRTWSRSWQSCSNVFWTATSVCRRRLAGESVT